MSASIEQAVEQAGGWLDLEGVEFVGQGEHEGADCVVVGVSRPVEEMRGKLPASLHGYPVIVEFSGTVQAG